MKKERRESVLLKQMVVAAMLGAVTIVLGLTPLGFIPLGVINATTMHIPVIIAGILEGPFVGALVGFIFGLSSLFNAITRPTPISIVFYNPLISILPRILIGIVSYYAYNILRGKDEKKLKILSTIVWTVISIFLLVMFKKTLGTEDSAGKIILVVLFLLFSVFMIYYSLKHLKSDFPVVLGAFLGSMTNTILVLGGIYLFYAQKYVEIMGKPIEQAKQLIFGVAITSGLPEAILSVIITSAVVKAMRYKR